MDRLDELLEEPLYMNGAFVRRWDELARLPRPDAGGSGAPSRPARGARPGIWGSVPRPRVPQSLRWEREPAVD